MDRQELRQALKNDTLFDYIANNYTSSSTYELKELILALLGVIYDNHRDTLNNDIEEELEHRDFFN